MLDGIWGDALRRETRNSRRRQGRVPEPPSSVDDGFVAALIAGGDSRLAVDPLTGVNKYLCAPVPSPGLVCAASCTASPIASGGFERAADAYHAIVGAPTAREREERLADHAGDIEARLLRYFSVSILAEAILCSSGTEALLTTAMLIAAERPGEPMTAILPCASETGTGVPRAAACRWFDGPPGSDELLSDCVVNVVEIPLRSPDGVPRPEDEVNDSYAAAVAGASGRPVVYLTHGTETGLIAPTKVPRGVDVIVDACQGRIEPDDVGWYLRRAWPVVITGSKFFGGPAFSGAVLFPRVRLATIRREYLRARLDPPCAQPEAVLEGGSVLGMVLRWTAVLDGIEAFAPRAAEMAAFLRGRAAAVERALGSIPGLVPVEGLQPRGSGWSGVPSIFTFAVRDAEDQRRLLSVAELRPLYEALARGGVLLGQPVSLGSFGGLRIAVGVRDLMEERDDDGLSRLFAAVEEVVTSATGSRRRRWWARRH